MAAPNVPPTNSCRFWAHVIPPPPLLSLYRLTWRCERARGGWGARWGGALLPGPPIKLDCRVCALQSAPAPLRTPHPNTQHAHQQQGPIRCHKETPRFPIPEISVMMRLYCNCYRLPLNKVCNAAEGKRFLPRKDFLSLVIYFSKFILFHVTINLLKIEGQNMNRSFILYISHLLCVLRDSLTRFSTFIFFTNQFFFRLSSLESQDSALCSIACILFGIWRSLYIRFFKKIIKATIWQKNQSCELTFIR
jgi:hypothetical protein